MKQKITQWAEKVSTTPKHAWGTMLTSIVIPAVAALVIGLVSPNTVTGPAFGGFVMVLVGGFISAMISAGLLSWASKILGLEKKGFVRALGITSFANLLLLPLSVLALVLVDLVAASPVVVAPILVIVYVGMIVLGILLALYLYSHVYGITKGQAFGLAATSYGLLFVILLGIFAVIAFVLSFIIPGQLEKVGDYRQMQMEAMTQSGGLELDAESMAELQAALQGINATAGVAEETEL